MAGFSFNRNLKVQENLGEGLELATVKMADLDYSAAALVQGVGQRFIIPVRNLGAENETVTVKNWKGEAVTVVGYKFANATDGALQAVDGDGSGVIIVGLNPEQLDPAFTSKLILEKIAALGGAAELSVAKLDQLVGFIHNDLGIPDTYNSNDKSVAAMVAVPELTQGGERPCGLFEKQEKPGPLAVFVAKPSEVLDGPHAGSANYPEGFVAVMIPPKNEGEPAKYRSIAPSAVSYCYALADGTKISDPKGQLANVE